MKAEDVERAGAGYIIDLTKLGTYRCAVCKGNGPGSSKWDLRCRSCGACVDSGCLEPDRRDMSPELEHVEFACPKCSHRTAWHQRWERHRPGTAYLSLERCAC